MTKLRLAIIEDEPLAAQRLTDLLESYAGAQIVVVGEAESIAEATTLIPTWDIDLLLCDIRLADGLSFRIWEHIDVKVPTIFTTAYEEYALRAFKVNSVDYLLKPIQPNELAAALDKYLNYNSGSSSQLASSPTPQVLSADILAQVMAAIKQPEYTQRLISKVGDRLLPIAVTDISYFQSIDRISWAYGFDGSRHPVNETIEDLATSLNPKVFARLNRAVIAQAKGIQQLTAYSNSRYRAHLQGHSGEPIIIARDRVNDVKAWLAGT